MASDIERIIVAIRRIAEQSVNAQSKEILKTLTDAVSSGASGNSNSKTNGGIGSQTSSGSTKTDPSDTTGDLSDDQTGTTNDGSGELQDQDGVSMVSVPESQRITILVKSSTA